LKHNIYNIGFENLKISEIANKIKKRTGAKIRVNKNKDIRSYRQDSSRFLRLGFKPKYNVDFAINELIYFFKTKTKLNFTNKNFNLLRMKKLNIK
jgi:nucleoside-diphosphate-sugar epimerase